MKINKNNKLLIQFFSNEVVFFVSNSLGLQSLIFVTNDIIKIEKRERIVIQSIFINVSINLFHLYDKF